MNVIVATRGLAMAAALLGATAFSGTAVGQVSMTFAHSENPNAMAAANAYKTIVESNTDGAVEVNLVIHHALGGDRDIIDQLRLGELELYVPGGHALAELAPAVQMWSAPFLFRDRAEFFELFKDPEYHAFVQDWILDKTNGMIRYEGAAENSVRHLYSRNGPIRTPDDLSQIRLRVPPTPLNMQLWEALGPGELAGMSGSERDQALQTGIIDAIEGSAAGAWFGGKMENGDLQYATRTAHVYSPMLYVYNADFWDGLDAEHRDVLNMATNLAIWVQNGHAITEEQAAFEAMEENGRTVTTPTPSQRAAWEEIAAPVGEEFIEKNVPAEFAEATRTALERTRERLAVN